MHIRPFYFTSIDFFFIRHFDNFEVVLHNCTVKIALLCPGNIPLCSAGKTGITKVMITGLTKIKGSSDGTVVAVA